MAPATLAGATPRAAQVRGRWDRDSIIDAIREWDALYGEPPRAADWNPSAAKWSGQPWRIERYRAGDWPSLNAAKRAFGGALNAAIEAAGLEPHKPGPKRRGAVAPVLVDGFTEVSSDARAAMRDLESDLREAREKVAVRERMLARERETSARLRGDLEAARRATKAARRE